MIRSPRVSDVSGIKTLLDKASKNGDLLPRSAMELFESVRDFVVYVDEEGVGGCCALHVEGPDLAEIRSLAVRENLRGRGLGSQLVNACLESARGLGIPRVYALTRSPVFFKKQGFVEIDKQELPHKVFRDCVRCHLFPDCDEVAFIRDLGTE